MRSWDTTTVGGGRTPGPLLGGGGGSGRVISARKLVIESWNRQSYFNNCSSCQTGFTIERTYSFTTISSDATVASSDTVASSVAASADKVNSISSSMWCSSSHCSLIRYRRAISSNFASRSRPLQSPRSATSLCSEAVTMAFSSSRVTAWEVSTCPGAPWMPAVWMFFSSSATMLRCRTSLCASSTSSKASSAITPLALTSAHDAMMLSTVSINGTSRSVSSGAAVAASSAVTVGSS